MRMTAKRNCFRPTLETLEARLTPAALYWEGHWSSAAALSNNWVDGGGNPFGRIPTTGDDVVFDTQGQAACNWDYPCALNSITSDTNFVYGLNVNQNLSIVDGNGTSIWESTHNITVAAGKTLAIQGSTFWWRGGDIVGAGDLVVMGTTNNTADLIPYGTVATLGTSTTVGSGGAIHINSTDMYYNIDLTADLVVASGGLLYMYANGDTSGGTLGGITTSGGGEITNAGDVKFDGDNGAWEITIDTPLTNVVGGVVTLLESSHAHFTDVVTNEATVLIKPGSDTDFDAGLVVDSSGLITMPSTIWGQANINGDVTYAGNGTLNVNYSELIINGDLVFSPAITAAVQFSYGSVGGFDHAGKLTVNGNTTIADFPNDGATITWTVTKVGTPPGAQYEYFWTDTVAGAIDGVSAVGNSGIAAWFVPTTNHYRLDVTF